MKPKWIFGLDIGTRTTVIHYYNASQRLIAPFKPQGNIRIPSAYKRGELCYGSNLLDAVREGAVSPENVVSDFKIDFWKSDSVEEAAASALQGWLDILWVLLKKEYPQALECAKFCFTYPAQRNVLEPRYKRLIVAAGFPVDDVFFLDEPTAAVYGCIENYGGRTAYEFVGKGLILDVGAGTTDFSLVENRGAGAGLVILDSSSTKLAGNDFTKALGGLLKTQEEKVAFRRYLTLEPQHLDSCKEAISEYYFDKANQGETMTRNVQGVGRFSSVDFAQFLASVEPQSASIVKHVEERLAENDLVKEDLQFVIGTGGGALHSGLAGALGVCFGNRLIAVRRPQSMVSLGATYFARNRYYKNEKGSGSPDVKNVIASKVYLRFPDSTGQKRVVIFEEGAQVAMEVMTRGSASVVLDSNWFFAEGSIFLCIGTYSQQIGSLDIQWFEGGEAANHPGSVEWEYEPASRLLTVSVSLRNTKLSQFKKEIVKQAEVFVMTKGVYSENRAG